MKTSKAAIVVSATVGKAATIIGIILLIISAPLLIVFFTDLQGDGAIEALFIFVIPTIVIGLLFIRKGSQIKHRIKRFKSYVSLISVSNITSFDGLASHTAKDVAFVRTDLQKMIHKKFFTNAYLDLVANKIHIGVNGSGTPQTSNPPTELLSECRNCGARRTSHSQFCEYCGSAMV